MKKGIKSFVPWLYEQAASGNLKVSVNGRDISGDVRDRMNHRQAGVGGRGAGGNGGPSYVGGKTRGKQGREGQGDAKGDNTGGEEF